MTACGAGWFFTVPFCAWKSSSSKDLLQHAPQHPACLLLSDPEPARSSERFGDYDEHDVELGRKCGVVLKKQNVCRASVHSMPA